VDGGANPRKYGGEIGEDNILGQHEKLSSTGESEDRVLAAATAGARMGKREMTGRMGIG